MVVPKADTASFLPTWLCSSMRSTASSARPPASASARDAYAAQGSPVAAASLAACRRSRVLFQNSDTLQERYFSAKEPSD